MRAEAVAPGTGRRTLETGSCNPWIGSERGGPTPSWPFPCNPCNPWMALGYGDPTSPWPRPCPTNRTVAGRVLRQSLCFGLIRSKPGQSQSKSVKAGQSDFDYYFLQPHGPKPTQTDSIRPNPTAGGGVAMGNVIAVSMARSKHSMRGTRAMQLLRLSMNLSMQTSREVDRVLRTRLRLRSEDTQCLVRAFHVPDAASFACLRPSRSENAIHLRQCRVGGVLLTSSATFGSPRRRSQYLELHGYPAQSDLIRLDPTEADPMKPVEHCKCTISEAAVVDRCYGFPLSPSIICIRFSKRTHMMAPVKTENIVFPRKTDLSMSGGGQIKRVFLRNEPK